MSHPLEYVVDKALMMCDKGGAPAFFTPTYNTSNSIDGLKVSTEADKIPITNIPAFTLCAIKNSPCTPVPTAWQDSYDLLVKGQKTLIFKCTMQCGAGGKMEFLTSGQIPLSAEASAAVTELQKQADHDLKEAEAVGESGFWEGMIPFWGSGRDLVHHVQTGNWGWAAFDVGMLVWDAGSIALGAVSFGAGTALMQGGKAAIKGTVKAVAKSLVDDAIVQPIKGLGKLGAGTVKLATKEGRQIAKDFFKQSVDDLARLLGKACVHACFVKGTLVWTSEGLKEIQNISVGDFVWSYDDNYNNFGYKKVTETFKRKSQSLVAFSINGEEFRVTAEHPFLVNGQWLAAGMIKAGDILNTSDGTHKKITSTRLIGKAVVLDPGPSAEHDLISGEEVYNFEVEDWHTYFVGTTGILTHNKCDEITEMVVDANGNKVRRLKPSTTYTRNGYTYKTDAYGRIIEAKGTLRLNGAPRDNYAQRVQGKGDGRQTGDAGGHLIGSQFGGIGNNANMVPMNHDSVNAYPNGTWGSMEANWQKNLAEGKSVEVNIKPIYTDATGRPTSFRITEIIDGVKKPRVINNF